MSFPNAQEVAVKPPMILWDLILSVVLLLLAAVIDVIVTFSSLFLVMASDSCGATSACNLDQMSIGWIVAMVAPSLILIATVVVAIVRFVRRRRAWWFVLIGFVVMLSGWGLGVWLVFSAVQGG